MRRILAALVLIILALAITGSVTAAEGPTFDELYEEGGTLLAASKGEEAYALFEQALAQRRGSLEAMIGQVESLRFTKRKTKADEILKLAGRILAVDTKCGEAYRAMGYAYWCLYNNDKMYAAYKKGIEVDPQYLLCYYDLGLSYLVAGRNEEAMEVYRQAVSVAPSNAETHAKLGDCFAWVEELDAAIEEYAISLNLQPEQAGAHRGLARVYMGRDNEQAVDEWKMAMEFEPGVASDHVELGDIYNNMQRYTDAVEEYQAAIRIDPGNSLAYNRLGWVFSGLGRHEEALEQGKAVLALASNDDSFEKAQGRLLIGVGRAGLTQYNEAMAEFKEAIRLLPDFTYAWYHLGMAQADAGSRSEALETYEVLKALNEDLAQQLFSHIVQATGLLDSGLDG
jgi:tetratricopeptide (TPR) repeat protein